MDDSNGQGRYDRYTLVIAGEMCMRFVETGDSVPKLFSEMLRKTSKLMLQMANAKGNGISYGRSLGAHGDTAVLETLPIAAYLGLLSQEEIQLAYSYSLSVAQKYVNFWIDEDTGVVNMWDKGRKIDPYRSKERLLNEDLDLCMKLIKARKYWSHLGLDDSTFHADYERQLQQRDPFQYFSFEEGRYSRGLAVIRDRHHVILLPIIGGHYQETPYLPIPCENNMLITSPKTKQPFLVPVVILQDGSRLMPVEYMERITHEKVGDKFQVRYTQDQVCLLGQGVEPQADGRLRSETRYTFSEGRIEREDWFFANVDVDRSAKRKRIMVHYRAVAGRCPHDVSSLMGIRVFEFVNHHICISRRLFIHIPHAGKPFFHHYLRHVRSSTQRRSFAYIIHPLAQCISVIREADFFLHFIVVKTHTGSYCPIGIFIIFRYPIPSFIPSSCRARSRS